MVSMEGGASGALPRGDDPARLRAGKISLVAGTSICVGKFAVAAATGSTAVFSDAMESIVNVAAAALLLYTLVVASRPADRDHPYGHGKVEFFSAGAEGALIAVAALMILWEATADLVRGPEIRRLDLAIGFSGLLALGNAALGSYLVRTGRRTGSEALVADGRHVLTDVVTTLGVIVGLGMVWWTGAAVLDPIMALVVAVWILRTGWVLVRSAVGGLMDEADESLLDPICSSLERRREPAWIDVHGLRTWRSGAVQHTDLHLSVPRYLDADALHEISDRIRDAVVAGAGRPGDVIVHFDPCRPRQCPICPMADCRVRQAPLRAVEPIGLERAVRGEESLESGEPISSRARRR
jgi:cation diffusion facilitator family transporter